MRRAVVLGLTIAATVGVRAQQDSTWRQPFDPLKVVGNIYYVGTRGLSSFLIVTPAGGIIIDSGEAESVPFIRANVEKLGFRIADVRLLLTGHAHFDNAPPALGPNTLDQGVTHDLTIPNLLNVGIAYRVLPTLLLTGAWTFDRFIVYKRDLFQGDLGTSVVVNRNYKNGYTFRVGGELEDVVPKLTLRAGVLRDISPTRPDAFSPTIPDANSTAFALGVGYEISPGLALNATYFHAFFDEANTVGADVFAGRFETRANIVTVGITFRPGEKPRGDSAGLWGNR